jgi:hypothetical protein
MAPSRQSTDSAVLQNDLPGDIFRDDEETGLTSHPRADHVEQSGRITPTSLAEGPLDTPASSAFEADRRRRRPPEAKFIREQSAAQVLASLEPIQRYDFHDRVDELYLGRWVPQPGWAGTILDLPERSGDNWFITVKEKDSQVLIMATTAEESAAELRVGNAVTVLGRISRISLLKSVSLSDATIVARQ